MGDFENLKMTFQKPDNSDILKIQKIGIFGDYDVDGATSTALLGNYFSELNLDYEIYIPDRKKERSKVKTKKMPKSKCQNCAFTTNDLFLLKDHVENNHSLSSSTSVEKQTDLKWKCVIPDCSLRFCTQKDLKKHMSEDHGYHNVFFC
mgnify:CR=1 FL=1